MLLKDKTAIVTGGSRGIGKEIVLLFLKEGAAVYYISMNESPFRNEIEETAAAAGSDVFWRKGDVSNEEEISGVIKDIIGEAEKIDILVNNAGITRDGLIFRMPAKNWEDVINTNLNSAFYVSKPVAMKMAGQRSGSIINITSIVGIIGNGGQTNYSASKAGLIGFTKSLAKEVAGRGVKVNAVAPGYIQTDMTEKLNDKAREMLVSHIPMKEIGKPEYIANTVLFLASEQSSYITGQVIGVDGGMGM